MCQSASCLQKHVARCSTKFNRTSIWTTTRHITASLHTFRLHSSIEGCRVGGTTTTYNVLIARPETLGCVDPVKGISMRLDNLFVYDSRDECTERIRMISNRFSQVGYCQIVHSLRGKFVVWPNGFHVGVSFVWLNIRQARKGHCLYHILSTE